MRACALSRPGPNSSTAVDRYLCDDSAGLFAVATGMGQNSAGAANTAINYSKIPCDREPWSADLATVFHSAHAGILRHCQFVNSVGSAIMTVLRVRTPKNGERSSVDIFHVGDARCYLVRHGICRQVTEAQNNNGQLTNLLGGSPSWYKGYNYDEIEPQSGDLFVLCSRGLNVLSAEEIADATATVAKSSTSNPEELIAHHILLSALSRDQSEPLTVIVIGV